MSSVNDTRKIERTEALAHSRAAVARVAQSPMPAKASQADAANSKRKPNIILMVADDLGYGDLSCYGCDDISTANIDALASQGVRFTQSYVASPICSPARVSMLTGKYPQRTSLPHLPNSKDPNDGLCPDEITLADVLKHAGYATGMVGKWHLGYGPQFWPRRRGFDEFFGYLSGWADYIEHTYRNGERWMFRDDTQIDFPEGYLTDILTDEAECYIERHSHHPFFLYLPYNAPHGPLVAPDGTRAKTRVVYRAIVENFDQNVGRVMRKLKDTGLEEDTFVIFISDNGADEPPAPGSNLNLRGGKSTVWEGGIRTPFIAKWPGHIRPGTSVDEPIISMDVFNTIAAVGKASVPAGAGIDGKDTLGVMQGKEKSPHGHLFWSFANQFAVRHGKWKLVVAGIAESRLYDVDSDPAEKRDLAPENAEIVKDLAAKLEDWRRDIGKGLVSSSA